MTLRLYRIALIASVALNVLLVTAIWLYVHFEGALGIVEEAVGFFD